MRSHPSDDDRIFSSVSRGVYRLPCRLANGRWCLMAVDRTGRVIAEREYEDRAGHEIALRALEEILDQQDAVPALRILE